MSWVYSHWEQPSGISLSYMDTCRPPPLWDPPSSWSASGPSPAPTQQPVGTRIGMLRLCNQLGKDKPHPPEGLSKCPTTTPPASSQMPQTWPCPPEGPGPGPTHKQCTGPRSGTPRVLQPETPYPALPTSKPAPALKPSSPSSGKIAAAGQLQPAVTGPSPLTSRPTQASGVTPPISSLTPAKELRGPQPDPRTGSSCQRASTRPQDPVSPPGGWGTALGLPGARLSPPVSQH